MQKKIGNVVLNYRNYGGKDLYSDGNVEDRLLDIVEKYPEEEFNTVISEARDWAILYHLSDIRKNIVNRLPLQKTDTVLEIGSGCGAVTGALAEMAGQVTCVELSEKRSRINATRNRKYDNVEILLGNFQTIEPELGTYDFITLIGVFEYGEAYINTESPYSDFLKIAKRHLKENGKLVIAIENRLGLKYWAGCREDHNGMFFDGLEGYTHTKGIRTFSKTEWEKILEQAGFENVRFYYPYPDYKLPLQIFSDERLPQKGELNNNFNNFDRDRMELFDEAKVFDTLIGDGLFPLFANSFLILAGVGESGTDLFCDLSTDSRSDPNGERDFLREMYPLISPGCFPAAQRASEETGGREAICLQIFYSFGDGFCEENSERIRLRDGVAEFSKKLPEGVTGVRLDPGDLHAVCNIGQITFECDSTEKQAVYQTNGCRIQTEWILFKESDPQIIIDHVPEEASRLYIDLKVIPIENNVVEGWMESIRGITEENRALKERVLLLEQRMNEQKTEESMKKTVAAQKNKKIRRKN
ncbi:MAG: class I SAM-dependent methyltransferase [Clostridiales bacterium]|nr:class I SAM-dependent methyltransferase [Clostridiales bacterium]